MKNFALLILVSFFGVIMTASIEEAKAQVVAEQPCDPAFFKQMQARAWLESEREIMQNQNLIFKADSVLEYTCFDRFANVAAWQGGNIFSHTEYFGEMIIPRGDPNALEVILDNVIGTSLELYQLDNFAHSFLGGRGHFPGIDLDQPPGREWESILLEEPYECAVMAQVWEKAKCLNFVHNDVFAETDGFYPLETLTSPDGEIVEGYDVIQETRMFPIDMACLPADQGFYEWEGAIADAENLTELYEYQAPLALVFEDVAFRLDPAECSPAILTGVEIILSTGPTGVQDGVCSNPGCTFVNGGCVP